MDSFFPTILYTQADANYDEKRYINSLGPLLNQAGFSAHFITDTSRSGVQPTKQQQWGDWYNVMETGFDFRPSSEIDDPNLDLFVWVKPGRECDGTSNTSATRYDYHCPCSYILFPFFCDFLGACELLLLRHAPVS